MVNRYTTQRIHRLSLLTESLHILRAGAKRRGTVYHPVAGHIVANNFGTSVRPDVHRITVNAQADETIASYLARGGQIHLGTPKTATGALTVGIVRSRSTRVKTSRG